MIKIMGDRSKWNLTLMLKNKVGVLVRRVRVMVVQKMIKRLQKFRVAAMTKV